MKHIVWAFIAVLAIAGGTGCNKMHGGLLHKNKACSECGGKGCPACGHGHGGHAGHGGHGHPGPGRHHYAGHGGQAHAGHGGGGEDMSAVYNQNGDPHYYGGGQGGNCPNCGPGAGGGGYIGQGPGQVVYPYYTTRGPRDFLMNNPPELGP
jgi:hypothetical protein